MRPAIREATEDDWAQIFPFYAAIVADGRTHAYPEGQTMDQAPPGGWSGLQGARWCKVMARQSWAQRRWVRTDRAGAHGESKTVAVHLWESLGFRIIGTAPEGFEHRDHGLVGLLVMFLRF